MALKCTVYCWSEPAVPDDSLGQGIYWRKSNTLTLWKAIDAEILRTGAGEGEGAGAGATVQQQNHLAPFDADVAACLRAEQQPASGARRPLERAISQHQE
jgi:hypothetical protein